jgi:hypothetical protein
MHTISRMAALFLFGAIFVPMINAARMADRNDSTRMVLVATLSLFTVAVERTACSAAVIIDRIGYSSKLV